MQTSHQNPQPETSSSSSSLSSLRRDPKTALSFSLALATSLLLFLFLSSSSKPHLLTRPDPFLFPSRPTRLSDPSPPSIAYLISGSDGDSDAVLRLLRASYHPRNRYLLHLDRRASQPQRDRLARAVAASPLFAAAGNVDVVGRADFAYAEGSSALAAVLRAAAVMMRLSESWDWFVCLEAGDYPIVTQDDLLHILSYLPKSVNFVKHSSYIGWRESKKLKPIIVDPGLYLSEKTAMFYASQKRELPNAYRLFTGSSFSILSRDFIEFCVLGTDNLPRITLMYFSNTPSSLSSYFPTVLCNSRQFNRTSINHNLKYANFDKPYKDEPRRVTSEDFDAMVESGAVFAAKFKANDPLLDRIDRELLGRERGQVVPGGWCLGQSRNDTCSVWGDADILRPGLGAKRLEKLLVELFSNSTLISNRCIVE